MKILILLGDKSPEREVSLRSGRAVADALKRAGHQIEEYDPAVGYDGLSEFVGKADCVFPILHGVGGEDGQIQKQLEKHGFKYLGSDSRVSRLCFDKVAFKKILNKLSILTPGGEVVTKESFAESPLITRPFVLKPIKGGSTIDCFIIREPQRQNIDPMIFDKYPKMLLEELIVGTETTVPVLDHQALPVIEIIPPEGQEFDYQHKYDGSTQELCPPKNISEELQKEARQIAERVHKEVGARHLSRTDVMIDKDNKLVVLELNTMPGMTDQSLFPKAAAQAGINMEELVNKFLKLALA